MDTHNTNYSGKTIKEMVANTSNNTTMICRATVGGKSILFLGDAAAGCSIVLEAYHKANKSDATKYFSLKSDIVQMAHHGGRNGQSKAVYQAIDPDISLWPCTGVTHEVTGGSAASSTNPKAWLTAIGAEIHPAYKGPQVFYFGTPRTSATVSIPEKLKPYVFDAQYYAERYPELKEIYGTDEAKLYAHFITYGIEEGRCASPYFDVVYYTNQNNINLTEYVKGDYEKAMNHFITYMDNATEMSNAAKRLSVNFDPAYYRSQYADLSGMTTEFQLLQHYAEYGQKEGRRATKSALSANTVNYHHSCTFAKLDSTNHTCKCSSCGASYTQAHSYVYGLCACGARQSFTVRFYTEDGTLLQESTVSEGEQLAFAGELPEKEADREVHYTFQAWTMADGAEVDLDSINGDMDLYATYSAQPHEEGLRGSVDATCTEVGYSGDRYCVICDYAIEQGTVIPAMGHREVVDQEIPATCTTSGLTEGSHCEICNAVIKAQTTISPIGHSYASKITTAPTCTAEGERTFTCDDCGHSYIEAIPELGHTPVVDEAVPATCTNSGLTEGSHCSVCNTILITQEGTARLGHDYGNYVSNGETHTATCTRCDKTQTSSHTYSNGTCVCGAKEILPPVLDESIKILHTLDLASDISVTFAVAKTALESYESYYLECVLPEYSGNALVGTSTVEIQPVVSGNYYYFTLTGITAVRMGDMVEAVLHMTKDEQEYYSKTDRYSVATYAYGMLNSSKDAKMLNLCADLLRYGAEAQSFKGYRTDALVDAEMTEVHRGYLSNTETLVFTATDSYLGDLENPVITWVGKTLDLGSKVGMKFVFSTKNYSGNIADLTMKVTYRSNNGEEKTVVLTGAEAYKAADKQYSFTFYGLLASELRTIVDVAICEGETRLSETLRYSAESYASKTNGTVLALLTKALFAYSDSAREYFR